MREPIIEPAKPPQRCMASFETVFVGRERELSAFESAFDAALGGGRQIVTLYGEPGIGKTRCARAFAESAEDRGALVLWARCYEGPGSPPFWPWIQLVRNLVEASSANEAALLMGSGRREIGLLVPELAEVEDGDQESQDSLGDALDAGRHRIFDAVARLFSAAACQVPLVLIFDDVHWADPVSLALLQFVARSLERSRIVLVCTYRETELRRGHPLLDLLGEFSGNSASARLRLRGLESDEVTALSRALLGSAAYPSGLEKMLVHRTDGNPFFVIELLRVMLEDESYGDGMPQRIPDGVRETIGRRLSRLSRTVNEVLASASVLGRDFRAVEVASIGPHGIEESFAALAQAETAGMVTIVDAANGRYRFTHALIRETLYEELSLLDRMRLHGLAGDALVSLNVGQEREALARIATHYTHAASIGRVDEAASYSHQAGDEAMRLDAYAEALAHYEEATQALSLNGRGDDPRLHDLVLGRARALKCLGSIAAAVEVLKNAIRHAREGDDAALLAELAGLLTYLTQQTSQAHQFALLESALELLPEGDSDVRAASLAAFAVACRTTGDQSRAATLVEESIAMAGRLQDLGTLGHCCMTGGIALRGDPGALPRRLEIGAMLLESAERAEDGQLLAEGYFWQSLSLIEAGEIAAAERLLDRYANLPAARVGLHEYRVGILQTQLLLMRGEYAGLEARIDALLAIGSKTRREDAEGVYGAQMFALKRDLGRLQQLAPLVQGLARQAPGKIWRPGLMILYTELGLHAEAEAELDALSTDDFASVAHDDMRIACLVYASEACYALNKADCGTQLLALLEPFADRLVSHPTAVCMGSANLYLAMLATASGDDASARDYYERALDHNAAVAAWPALARTECRYARLLLDSGSHQEAERARSLLRDAEQIATRLGMQSLSAEVSALQQVDGAEIYPDGLTAREAEVLELIAIGRSNKDVAKALSISLNTVATHVRNILNKTHCANRTEAAAYAARNELTRETRS